MANDEYMKIATKILKSWLKDFKTESSYLQTEGPILTKEETERIINEYLEELEIEKLINLNFTKNIIAPTSISHDTKRKKAKMNIRLPIEYRADRMRTVLHHEIGTHFIRKLNDKKQKWYGK